LTNCNSLLKKKMKLSSKVWDHKIHRPHKICANSVSKNVNGMSLMQLTTWSSITAWMVPLS
jgi:hypothetical protein